MRHTSAIATALLSLLFSTAFVTGKGLPDAPEPAWPDSLRSVWFYTEGIKQQAIHGDTAQARRLLHEAIRRDTTYAPAYYELAANGLYATAEEAVELAQTACRLDSTNKWYQQFLGQILIYAKRYDEALNLYRGLMEKYPKNPDNYRVVAALYEQKRLPIMALVTLDSAELRFGKIEPLDEMKRHLLVATNQTARAIDEARAAVAEAPYEASPHVVLAGLYAIDGKDSLARAEYGEALRIDSTNVQTLVSLADFYTERRDYLALLATMRTLFASEDFPVEAKIRRFEQFTSDLRFYREYYFQINALASTLAILYPDDQRVVELYAGHLIASGELEQALALYKIHLDDQPPVQKYYHTVIDIESYLERPDSVDKYVNRALALFPDRVDFRVAKGNVLGYSKHYDRSIEAYKEALEYADTDSLRGVIWGLIGDAWHQKAVAEELAVKRADSLSTDTPFDVAAARKAMKQCYKAYDRSLELWNDNVVVLNNYAYFLSLEERDLGRALAMASLVVSLTDNNPTYLDTYGWVLFKMGRTEEARKQLQKAVALDAQQSPELMVHYGDVLHALGEQFMAEVYWRRALEKGYDTRQIESRFAQPARTPQTQTQSATQP